MVGWAPEWCPLATLCGSMDQFMNYTALAGSLAKGAVNMKINKNTLFNGYLEGDRFVITKDMLDGVDQDTAKTIKNLYEADHQCEQRNGRCIKLDGKQCRKKCSECKEIPDGMVKGTPLSYDKLMEAGYKPHNDIFPSPEEWFTKQELYIEMYTAINTLDKKDREIILLFSNGKTEREIGAIMGMPQRTVNYRKKKSFTKIRKILEKY